MSPCEPAPVMTSHKSSSAKPDGITSPSSFVNALPTPPATDERTPLRATFPQANRVVAFFKDIKSGYADRSQPWRKFQLLPREYDEIEPLLLADTDTSLWGFVGDKVRYDFDGDRNQLIVRLPKQLHVHFLSSVEHNIDAQLRSFATSTTLEESVINFARRVQNSGSPDILFPSYTDSETDVASHQPSKSSPDDTYYHRDAKWPGVILEMSYSQKNLGKLADLYIQGSNASVRAVVGLDIEYQRPNKTKAGSKEAVFSVWRPEIIPNDEGDLELVTVQKIKDQPFRDAQGNPTSSPGLELLLSDFAPSCLSQAITDQNQSIKISTDELRKYLHKAEERLRRQPSGSLHKASLPAGVKKRWESTPPDVLDDKNERKYRMAEKKAGQRRDNEDPDWGSGGTSSESAATG